MACDEPTSEALERRHARGETWEEIALSLDVSTTTLRKRRDPAVAARYAATKTPQTPSSRRAYDLQRLDARRDRCQLCGRLRGRGSEKKGAGICARCRKQQGDRRDERIIELHGAGVSPDAIAAELGMTGGHAVSNVLSRLAREGRVAARRPHRKPPVDTTR